MRERRREWRKKGKRMEKNGGWNGEGMAYHGGWNGERAGLEGMVNEW